MKVTVNMPQMAANGLSENWLFRCCGNLHWQALCDSLGIRSADLVDDSGDRLYPTFVAISARYSEPLSAVRENDELESEIDLARFGGSFFHSRIGFSGPPGRFGLEMLTAFVARDEAGRNELHKSTPRPGLADTARKLPAPPAILALSQKLRRGDLAAFDLDGIRLDLSGPSLGLTEDYEPSPYVDFNGVNLLYFAAYPTICDTLERRLVRRHDLLPGAADFALATSTVAREVCYHGNADLGVPLRLTLNLVERTDDRIAMHSTLTRLSDGRPIADLLTGRRLLAG